MSRIRRISAAVIFAVLQAPLAMSEAATEKGVEALFGHIVMARYDLPASSDGVNVRSKDGRAATVEHNRRKQLIGSFGFGVAAGEIVAITKVKTKKRHVEIHLKGGGRSAWGAALSSAGPEGPKKNPGGSRINLRFDRKIAELPEPLSLSQAQNLLRGVLVFDTARMRALKPGLVKVAETERRILTEAAKLRQAAQRRQSQDAQVAVASSPREIESMIAPALRTRLEARAAIKFCLGYIRRDFEEVAVVAYIYQSKRAEWRQTLPSPVADKRYRELLARDRPTFQRGADLFHMEGGKLNTYLRPGARLMVTDLKPGTTQLRNTNFVNAFVEISYSRQAAPVIYGGRRVKKTYLVIPVSGSFVLANRSGIEQQAFSPFLPAIKRLGEADEYW